MKSIEAVKRLHEWDKRGRYLFYSRDLAMVFGERGDTLRSTIKRLLEDEVLVRAARDLYLYALSFHLGGRTIHDIARYLRPGEYVYESLESAASQWGIISQIPLDRMTVVTTGRSGEFKTPFGVVEFTHTDAQGEDIIAGTVRRDANGELPLATKDRTLRDLLRFGRSTELIDEEVMCDED